MNGAGASARPTGSGVVLGLLFAGMIGVAAGRWTHPIDLGPTSRRPHVKQIGLRGLPDYQIDLNRATAAELSLLPGVGETIALRIVEHRKAFGDFHSVESLDDVRGVGPGIIERIRGMATVDDEP